MKLVVDLTDAKEVDKYGGKAANLAHMLEAYLPVPDGFVITTEAYRQFNPKVSENLKAEILEAFEKLGAQRVAVRSSAVAEDAANASWAGQLETVLNVTLDGLIEAVEYCWKSMQSERAQSYATDHGVNKDQQAVAVVVQTMVDSEKSGVMFTANPVTSDRDEMVIEAIYGLGELLVQGTESPESLTITKRTGKVMSRDTHQQKKELVYRYGKSQTIELAAEKKEQTILSTEELKWLVGLASALESYYGQPQDVEWAIQDDVVWLVQTRPITTLQDRGTGKHYLGDPGKLFYWGPSRAVPLYMGDFIVAEEQNFARMFEDPTFPNPPKTLVLFHGRQMVWLNKALEFEEFVTATFKAYEKNHTLVADQKDWQNAIGRLDEYFKNTNKPDLDKVNELLIAAWTPTLIAEFALYGAETVLHERLKRFDEKARQEIWGGMTLPDEPTYTQRLDMELVESKDINKMTQAYPWVEDGYWGAFDSAQEYFRKRLEIVQDNVALQAGSSKKREEISRRHKLNATELSALELARELSVFIDKRKEWMIRTRRYIQQTAKVANDRFKLSAENLARTTLWRLAEGKSDAFSGWSFMNGTNYLLSDQDAALAWDWYVEFRASKTVLKGLVASSAGRHFINGDVFIIRSPQDAVPDDAVLVVTSTSPSYVPLMRKARAVITDHGGMMSHAAIVARELGLPCVVGTKTATKILKTGDKIVIDLVTGEINR